MLDLGGPLRCEVRRKKASDWALAFVQIGELGLRLAFLFCLLSLNGCQCHGIDNIVNQRAT